MSALIRQKNSISCLLMYKPKIISLFAGCGGFDLGFHQCGYETVWGVEWNKDAAKTFSHNLADVIEVSDIKDIDECHSSVPDCDLILGGFPCQDFSVIGGREGIDANRGNLYKDFVRFVRVKNPKVFVAENVKGLMSANGGKAIKVIIDDFEDAGYTIHTHVYNFADYGVPQFRWRVLIVGIKNGLGLDFVHPLPTHGKNSLALYPYATAGEALHECEKAKFNNEKMAIKATTAKRLDLIPEGGSSKDISVDHPLYVRGKYALIYKRMSRNAPYSTLIASGGGGTWGYHYPDPRPFTNRERARLQTFPDYFQFFGSIAEVRKQIGNAVPPKGAHALAKTLLPIFTSHRT